jgi:hypothetical protein
MRQRGYSKMSLCYEFGEVLVWLTPQESDQSYQSQPL